MGWLSCWPRRKRGWRRRLLLLGLICCSPVLIPLACLSFPLVCPVAALYARSCSGSPSLARGRRRRKRGEEAAVERLPPLLQQYLEDQLGLVESAGWAPGGDGIGVDGEGW